MRTLRSASLRHLARHPAQLALALVGLSLGVGTLVAVDIATASAGRAFELSLQAVNGTATHRISGGPQGIDEQLYVSLRTGRRWQGSQTTRLAPVVEGYVSVGERSLQLLGIDPIAAAELDARPADISRADGWLDAIIAPGGVILAADTARELGLATGQSFTLDIGGRQLTARLLATVSGQRPGLAAVILTDVSQAQEWLQMGGRLSGIDLRLPEDAGVESSLRALLPAGVQLDRAQGRSRAALALSGAFTTNLKAMSLLALLVSTLLIYGSMSFAVVQRRRIFATLRALGATRGDVLEIVLSEAAVLGFAGAVVGVLVGEVVGRGLVTLVSRTINDLYFVVAVHDTVLPGYSIAKALTAGFGTALVGALLPALEVVGGRPQLGLRRSALEARAVSIAWRLAGGGLAFAAASAVVVSISERSLFAGFVALFLLLAGLAMTTPAILLLSARAASGAAGRFGALVRLALADICASLSRTGVAIAALSMALAAMIGVSIMVASFRESLREWLERSMRADIYVSAPGPGSGRPERRIDPVLLGRILALPEVVDYGLSRRATVELPDGPVALDAVKLAHGGYGNMPLISADPAVTWPAFRQGGLVISEPLAYRLHLSAGDTLTLPTDAGPRSFRICGVYREYGNERGNILIDIDQYRRWWHDAAITGAGLYVKPGAPVGAVMSEVRRISRGSQSLLMRSNAELRELSMSIFDRTFVITRVLNWLAASVAAIGLVSALLAWELERAHEVAILRSLGLTPGGAAVLIEAQSGFMGLVALAVAVPAGLLTAILLIDVINRRAFGWQIDLHLSVGQFTNALALAVAASLCAGVYPCVRAARASIASEIREE